MPGLTFEQIHQKLVEKFGDAVGPLSPPKKDPFCVFAAPRLREICRFLKDAPELYFDFLEDLTATDHPKDNLIRVVYHFYSYRHRHLFIAKVELDRKDPQVDSLEPLWKAANWMEREVFDLFGVTFKGHPDLRRILMPDDWVGTPLRKDYVEAGGGRGTARSKHSTGAGCRSNRKSSPRTQSGKLSHVARSTDHYEVRGGCGSRDDPQHGAAASVDPRSDQLRRPGGRRSDEESGAASRLPAPGDREDRGDCDVSGIHALHGPDRLPRRDVRQRGVRLGGGETLGTPDSPASPIPPRDQLRAEPSRLAPGFTGHDGNGHRCGDAFPVRPSGTREHQRPAGSALRRALDLQLPPDWRRRVRHARLPDAAVPNMARPFRKNPGRVGSPDLLQRDFRGAAGRDGDHPSGDGDQLRTGRAELTSIRGGFRSAQGRALWRVPGLQIRGPDREGVRG